MIERSIGKIIDNNLFKGKAIILLGARQVGKTTLIKQLFRDNDDLLWLNGGRNGYSENCLKRYRPPVFKAIFGSKKDYCCR